MPKPSIPSTNKLLPYNQLSPAEFERLCLWVIEREGYEKLQYLGEAGSDQGRDITAVKPTDSGPQIWAFQCKRYERIGATVFQNEVDKCNSAKAAEPLYGIVFATNARVSVRVRDQVSAYCARYGLACEFWAASELDMLVKKHPDIVQEFFDAKSEVLTQLVDMVGRHIKKQQASESGALRGVRVFICYKRGVTRDQLLADHLVKVLASRGHTVFMDYTLRVGEIWLEEIDRQIQQSDFLVVLLSRESADSEMVQAEIRRAYEYRKAQGRPHTLPVRVAYPGRLPYSIDAFVDPLQYVVWQSDADSQHVGDEILAAVEGRLPERRPFVPPSVGPTMILAEDGQVVTDEELLQSPLPQFDPRWLEMLEAPGGAVKLRDRFYIERDADRRLKKLMVMPGTTTTIRAPRQTGKTSLLVRGLHHARESGENIVNIDVELIDRGYLRSLDGLLRYLAELITSALRLNATEVDESWRGSLGPKYKLTNLLSNYILPQIQAPVVLAIDEVDRLLTFPSHRDFFALLRVWHNKRALDDIWNKLNIVLAISTEPYLLIPDSIGSPFNVGEFIYLEDFVEDSVRLLNMRHGSPIADSKFPRMMQLLGGHPYLTRRALYVLVKQRLAWTELAYMAASEQGPFSDHLRYYQWILRDQRDLKKGLKEIVQSARCSNESAFSRLLQAGLVKGTYENCTCRCGLYEVYFKERM